MQRSFIDVMRGGPTGNMPPTVIRSSEAPYVVKLTPEQVEQARKAEFQPLYEVNSAQMGSAAMRRTEQTEVSGGTDSIPSLAEMARLNDEVIAEIIEDDSAVALQKTMALMPAPRNEPTVTVEHRPNVDPRRVAAAYRTDDRPVPTIDRVA